MPKTRLFLSHSSKTDAARGRVLAIRDALAAAGYQPLVDKRFIQTGDEWRERIHRMLALCHGAVILFGKDALASPWVLKESTILAWRRELEKPDFRLVPLWLEPPDDAAFGKAPWHPLALGEVQYAEAGAPEKVVQRVLGSGVPTEIGAKTPYEALMGSLADVIRRAVGKNELETAADTLLDPGDDEALLGRDREDRVADLLARKIFRAGPESLEAAVDLMRRISSVWDETARKAIVEIIRPLWVEEDAGAMVAAALRRDQGFRDLALCCHPTPFWRTVAERHIDRACGVGGDRRVWPVEDGSAGDDEAHVTEAIRQWMRQEEGALAGFYTDDAELDKEISTSKKPFFVLVPKVLDGETLGGLRGKYGNATFLMHSTVPGEAKPELSEAVRYVVPELTLTEEKRAARGEVSATKFVKGKKEAGQ